MEIVAAVLCDFASVREGLLIVVGGGVTRLWREQLPAPLGIHLAAMLECTRDELARPHEIQVWVRTEDGDEIAHVRGGFALQEVGDLDPGETTMVPIPLSLVPVGVNAYGRYSVHLQVDDNLHKTLSLRVAARPPVV